MKTELMDFFDACRIAAGTKRAVEYKDGVDSTKKWFITDSLYVLHDGQGKNWKPTLEERREKAWSVEPEKPREVTIWGVCDDDGSSWIFEQKPIRSESGIWETQTSDPWGPKLLSYDNLSSKDEPRQYRLIPVDQPLIPWKRFDPETMPRKNAEIIVVVKSGNIYADRWVLVENAGKVRGCGETRITHYCRRDEFPFPEDYVK